MDRSRHPETESRQAGQEETGRVKAAGNKARNGSTTATTTAEETGSRTATGSIDGTGTAMTGSTTRRKPE